MGLANAHVKALAAGGLSADDPPSLCPRIRPDSFGHRPCEKYLLLPYYYTYRIIKMQQRKMDKFMRFVRRCRIVFIAVWGWFIVHAPACPLNTPDPFGR